MNNKLNIAKKVTIEVLFYGLSGTVVVLAAIACFPLAISGMAYYGLSIIATRFKGKGEEIIDLDESCHPMLIIKSVIDIVKPSKSKNSSDESEDRGSVLGESHNVDSEEPHYFDKEGTEDPTTVSRK